MTGKQAVFIIFVNAMISILISVGVALVVIWLTQTPFPGAQPVLAVQTATAASQPGEVSTPVVVNVPPTRTPVVYVVQAGDTLSSLALKFDVSAADIIVANEIENPDFLPAGQSSIIEIQPSPVLTRYKVVGMRATGDINNRMRFPYQTFGHHIDPRHSLTALMLRVRGKNR